MKKTNTHKADTHFTRNDFNLLYDYLWRDLQMAEYHVRNGRNKESRIEAESRYNTIKSVISHIEAIENSNLYFESGEIFKAE